MKNILKWIIGIVVALALVAGLVGLGFVMYSQMSTVAAQRVVPNAQTWNGPLNRLPGGRIPSRMLPLPGNRGFGRGLGPFAPGRMFFGLLAGLVPLALLLLLLYIVYQAGKGSSAPVTAPPAPSPAASATHACPKCQNPVQDGSKYCPECGEAQATS